MQTTQRFGAQIGNFFRAGGGGAKGGEGVPAGKQQVTLDEMRQTVIGVAFDQGFSVLQGQTQIVLLDFRKDLRQGKFRVAGKRLRRRVRRVCTGCRLAWPYGQGVLGTTRQRRLRGRRLAGGELYDRGYGDRRCQTDQEQR